MAGTGCSPNSPTNINPSQSAASATTNTGVSASTISQAIPTVPSVPSVPFIPTGNQPITGTGGINPSSLAYLQGGKKTTGTAAVQPVTNVDTQSPQGPKTNCAQYIESENKCYVCDLKYKLDGNGLCV